MSSDDGSNVITFGRKPKEEPPPQAAPPQPEVHRIAMALGEPDESDEFLAGFAAGAIFERITQAMAHGVSVTELAPMSMSAAHTKTIDKFCQFWRISVTYRQVEEIEDVVMCYFTPLSGQLTLV